MDNGKAPQLDGRMVESVPTNLCVIPSACMPDSMYDTPSLSAHTFLNPRVSLYVTVIV